ncbi:MAG: acyl-CoA dehydrogenase, partial [Myxococcales bacterium]|nr:acyl-CoA dehydrogenase [Myxococcales bacterium]
LVDATQCDAVVADFRRGEWFATALSEPTSGNLFLSPQQSAERVEGGWRLSGAKRFVTASERARYLWVNASCDGVPRFFIIDKDDSVEIQQVWDTMGMRGTRSQLVRFSDTLLPDGRESQIQPPNAVAVGLAWISIGIAEAAMRFAVEYAQERVLPPDGVALADLQWVQFSVADMSMQLGASRAFAEHMTALTDRGDPSMVALQMEAKTVANEAAISIARAALEIAGGSGYFRGRPIELYLRNAMSGPLMALSGAAVRSFMGKVLLGRGPKRD